jgi:hypothetical protein
MAARPRPGKGKQSVCQGRCRRGDGSVVAVVGMFSPDDLVQLKIAVAEARRHPERITQAPRAGRPNVLFEAGAGDGPACRQDGAGQACPPYLSVTAAATNFLRPALPGLVP